MNRHFLIFCIIAIVAGYGRPMQSFSAPDEVRDQWRRHIDAPLRWDNLKPGRAWISGPRPVYDAAWGMHVISLEPGETAEIHLPRGHHLRVLHAEQPLTLDDLDIAVSNGSGLHVFLPLQHSHNNHSLLIPPQLEGPCRVHVTRAARHQMPIRVGIFRSRHPSSGFFEPYRRLIPLPGPSVRMRRWKEPVSQEYGLLTPHLPLTVTIHGPTRLALETRFIYPPAERRLQHTYRVMASLDDGTPRVLDFITSSDLTPPLYIDGQPRVVGEPSMGYLDIPPGSHAVRFESMVSLYARLQSQDVPDYLIPSVNRSADSPPPLTMPPQSPALSFWGLEEPHIQAVLSSPEASIASQEQVALRLARDNRHPSGGLIGAMLMHQQARQQPRDASISRTSRQLLNAATGYEDLLPSHKTALQPQSFGWFLTPQLRRPEAHPPRVTITTQHQDSLLNQLSGAYFVPVPPLTAPQIYRLPPRQAPSMLRLAVDITTLSEAQDLWLQFDAQPAIRLHLKPAQDVASPATLPSLAELGLDLLRRQQSRNPAITLDGPFSARRVPARLRRAAHGVLPLPPEVRQISLWQSSPDAPPISAALQYRISRPYHLSETAYWEMVQHLNSPQTVYDLLVHHLTRLQQGPATFDPASMWTGSPDVTPDTRLPVKLATIELVNHWLPLLRFLRLRSKFLTTGLAPARHRTPSQPLPSTAHLIDRIRQAEADKDWITALDLQTQMIQGTTGHHRHQAELTRVTLLEQLGQSFLADRFLRGIYVFSSDDGLRRQAFARLFDRYTQAQDPNRLQALLATEVIRNPNPKSIRLLIKQLLQDGHEQKALMLGLALPHAHQPTSLLVQAAFRLGWHRTLEQLLPQLSSSQEFHLWQGYLAHRRGYDTAALHHFRQAGDLGRAFTAALVQGEAIRRDLTSRHAAIWEAAVHAWEAWQGRHPGPHRWHHHPQFITDYAGSTLLFDTSQDQQIQWFKSETERPVKLQFYGPLRIRLDARPIHPDGASQPIDGWIEVRQPDALRLIAITQNRPIQHLQMMDSSHASPGGRITSELTFGPGLHDVSIASPSVTLLLRVSVWRPVLPLNSLPLLTPETIGIGSHYPDDPLHVIPKRTARCQRCVTMIPSAYHTQPLDAVWTDMSAVSPTPPSVSPAVLHPVSAHPANPYTNAVREARALATGDLDTALALPIEDSPAAIQHRMELLVWLAEQHPDRATEALSHAHAIQTAHPQVPVLASLFARMARSSVWQPVASVQHSAGLRYLPITGWSPEHPIQRVRKALLSPLRADEQILSGLGRLVLSLNNTQPATLRISLITEVIAHLTAEPLTVRYQMDNQPAHAILLSPHEPYILELKAPEGRHTLRVSLDNPVANQFLRLRVVEKRAGATPQPLVRSIERAYHVATHQEPIRLLILGPSWLRVDEWQDGRIQTRYRAVPSGWQSIRIAPHANQSERLVRIHQRVTAPITPPLRARAAMLQPDLLPEPLGQLAHHPASPVVVLQDAYPLGRQEDGTWSFNSEWVSRTNMQEDTRIGENERFWELGATHRYFDADRRLYYETNLLGRARTDGGPTLGLQEHLVYRPRSRGLTLGLSGMVFVQLPAWDSDLAAAGTIQASAAQRFALGTKAFHLPSLELFGRVLSMDTISENAAGRVDQDVFTPFKADHRAGLQLAERLTYRPWLDTLWSGVLTLSTNEDLDIFQPDRLTFRLQWKQLVGAFQVSTAYRYAHFFADDDRGSARDRHTLYLDTRWEHWRPIGQHRLEVQLRLRYDPVSSDLGVLIGVSWHTGAGRGYRDFRPGSIDFRDVRQRRIPQVFNNRLYDAEAS